MDDKVRENRLRQAARRQELALVKSRRRDPRAFDFGTYMLIDPRANAVAFSAHQTGYGLDLDDVEKYLNGRA